MQEHPDPKVALLEACGTVTAEKARGWFANCGFVVA